MVAWVPSDLGSDVSLWFDTLEPASYTLYEDGIGGDNWMSRTGLIDLRPGSGRPRLSVQNGVNAFIGNGDYGYWRADDVDLIADENSDVTALFVGRGIGAYTPTLRMNIDNDLIRGIGTVGENLVGLPKGGNDLYTETPYHPNGNIVIGEWVTGVAAHASLWVDGGNFSTREIENTQRIVNRLEILSNGDSKTEYDFIIAAVIINRVLTEDERQHLEGWAAWSFNYVDRLPADHPFKLVAPTGGGAPVVPAKYLGAGTRATRYLGARTDAELFLGTGKLFA
jgi:hypothetical protein